MKHQLTSPRERQKDAEFAALDPKSGVVRCATTVRLTEDPLILDIGTADRANLTRTVQAVLEPHNIMVTRQEVITMEAGLIDRFHLQAPQEHAELPAGRQLAIQVALLEALDPELRWVASEMAELYPDEG